jgi:lysophospholipase L1-like esterase
MKKIVRYYLALFSLIVASIANSSEISAQNNKYGTLYYQRASLYENLPLNSSDIVFLGNSITQFGEWQELFDMPNVKNRGISGDIAQGVYDRLDPILKGKPAKIFLMIGINDVSHDLTADSIVCATKKIAIKICSESPSTRLYIQSVMPVNPSFNLFVKATTRSEVVKEINKGLKELCNDLNLQYVDIYSHLTIPGGDLLNPQYTNDGLHLMGAGYLRWVEVLKQYVND